MVLKGQETNSQVTDLEGNDVCVASPAPATKHSSEDVNQALTHCECLCFNTEKMNTCVWYSFVARSFELIKVDFLR